MKVLKKEKRDNCFYLLVLDQELKEVEIICNNYKKIESLGIKDDVIVSPLDVDPSYLEKLQELCNQEI